MYQTDGRLPGKFGASYKYNPDTRAFDAVVRPFGLTWQGCDEDGACSREMHQQLHRWFYGEEPPPGAYENDKPSVSRPPSEAKAPRLRPLFGR